MAHWLAHRAVEACFDYPHARVPRNTEPHCRTSPFTIIRMHESPETLNQFAELARFRGRLGMQTSSLFKYATEFHALAV